MTPNWKNSKRRTEKKKTTGSESGCSRYAWFACATCPWGRLPTPKHVTQPESVTDRSVTTTEARISLEVIRKWCPAAARRHHAEDHWFTRFIIHPSQQGTNGAPTDNVFDYFGSDLEEIFKISPENVETLADAYNKSGCGTSIRQFIEVTKRHVDPESAELYLFPLTAVAIDYYLDGEGAQCRLLDSNLKPKTKKAIQSFFSRLNEQGLYGLQTQYHVIGKLSELPALEDVTECEEIIQINDCADDPACYLPATRIKFAFSGRQKVSAVFSQDGLSRLISRLQKIHDEGSKAVARYKGAVRDLPVVG